jgi:hypothetical protein
VAKSRKNPTRGGGGSRKPKAKAKSEASFEVEEHGEGAPAAGTSLETALVYVTFIALLIGLVMAQMDMAATYDMGMLGG